MGRHSRPAEPAAVIKPGDSRRLRSLLDEMEMADPAYRGAYAGQSGHDAAPAASALSETHTEGTARAHVRAEDREWWEL